MLKLISQNEKLKYVDEKSGAIFYYRRISATEYRLIEKMKTHRGLTDFDQVGYEVVKKCLIDWENIYDDVNGELKPVKFSPELIEQLPGGIVNLLFIEIRSNTGISEEDEKN